MFLRALLSLSTIALLIACTLATDKPSRKVDIKWNPGCNITECEQTQNGSYLNVVHVTATGDDDIVHYLYSNYKAFSILIFRTDLSAKLEINWEDMVYNNESDYIQVKGGKIMEKAAYSVPTIYEFEDNDGKADINKVGQNFTIYHTSDLVWSKFSPSKGGVGMLEGKLNNQSNSTAGFKFDIRTPGDNSRDKSLPHLLLTAEAASIDYIINVPATFRLSKFGMELALLSSATQMDFTSKKTMDDEYTPGTFKLWNIEFKEANSTANFFQCKPIFYFYDPSTLENSTLALKYDIQKDRQMPQGIINGLFDAKSPVYAMNVSFGIQGSEKDAFYHSQTNYTIWSFSMGLGAAPVEKMSFVVTLVIAIGFGLPAFIIIGGVLGMIVKKLRGGRRSEFEPLN